MNGRAIDPLTFIRAGEESPLLARAAGRLDMALPALHTGPFTVLPAVSAAREDPSPS